MLWLCGSPCFQPQKQILRLELLSVHGNIKLTWKLILRSSSEPQMIKDGSLPFHWSGLTPYKGMFCTLSMEGGVLLWSCFQVLLAKPVRSVMFSLSSLQSNYQLQRPKPFPENCGRLQRAAPSTGAWTSSWEIFSTFCLGGTHKTESSSNPKTGDLLQSELTGTPTDQD